MSILEWQGTSKGISSTWNLKTHNILRNLNRGQGNYHVGDFNGDGIDDMICLYRNKDGSTDIYDWEGNKEGIIINDKVISHNSSENFAPELGTYYIGDFNGDKMDDLLCIYRFPDGSTSILE